MPLKNTPQMILYATRHSLSLALSRLRDTQGMQLMSDPT